MPDETEPQTPAPTEPRLDDPTPIDIVEIPVFDVDPENPPRVRVVADSLVVTTKADGDVAIALGAYNGGLGRPNMLYSEGVRAAATHARNEIEQAALLRGPVAGRRFLAAPQGKGTPVPVPTKERAEIANAPSRGQVRP